MIRSIIESETLEHFFWVGGKIDRFYKSDFGHIYFDLVDDRDRVRCMLHETHAGDITIDLKNHLEVEVYGDIHFYESRTEVQINVLDLRQTNASVDTRIPIEKLRAEGLYPPKRKQALTHIQRIGIITSRSSRAIGDFETTYQSAGERAVLAPLTWQLVHLEGERARQSIIDGITLLNENPEVDAIALLRGGGRYENLAVFDDVDVVRAICRSPKYIVTGIGHQRDRALADDVADHSAVTPTAAATFLADLCLRSRPVASSKLNANPVRKSTYSKRPETPAASINQPAQPSTKLQRGYNFLVIALLLLAIGAVMFLGFAILHTA